VFCLPFYINSLFFISLYVFFCNYLFMDTLVWFMIIVGVSTRGVPGPTSKIVVACPSPDGLARDRTRRGVNLGSCYPAPKWVRLQ
jgi:hypothetical protein